MLDEYKEICRTCAETLGEWKTLSRSELCNKFLEFKDKDPDLANSYLSAVIYKFWNVINHNYYSQQVKIASEQDCYDCVITAILYALDKHVWTDPSNALYNDINGPEKAINVCIKTGKLNFYTEVKRQKRKINYEALSLDMLSEDSSDAYYLPYYDKEGTVDAYVADKITTFFKNKDYFSAFVLDAIMNMDVFEDPSPGEDEKSLFSRRKLKRHLRNIDSYYCSIFAHKYNLDVKDVENSIKYINNLTKDRMDRNITNLFKAIAKDKEFLQQIRG